MIYNVPEQRITFSIVPQILLEFTTVTHYSNVLDFIVKMVDLNLPPN